MTQIDLITRADLAQFKKELLQDIAALLKPVHPDSKPWLRSSEVRKMLKISPGTLQNLRINGTFGLPRSAASCIINRRILPDCSKTNRPS